MLCGPFQGPKATVENPWLRCYQSLICLLYAKMFNLTFTSRKSIIFYYEKITLFLFLPPHKQNLKENVCGFQLFPGFQFRWWCNVVAYPSYFLLCLGPGLAITLFTHAVCFQLFLFLPFFDRSVSESE